MGPCLFPNTLAEFVETVLKCLPRPTPWVDTSPKHLEHLVSEFYDTYNTLRTCIDEHSSNGVFEATARFAYFLGTELKEGRKLAFDVAWAVLRRLSSSCRWSHDEFVELAADWCKTPEDLLYFLPIAFPTFQANL
jgi:hypothetical protein